jgi:hypothetical protein
MLAMGGGEAALLVIAIAIIGWVRRRVVVELVKPLRLGPFLIRIQPEAHSGTIQARMSTRRVEQKTAPHQTKVAKGAKRRA